MKNIQYTTSHGVPHQIMEDEFLCHKNGSEWWYCTGFLVEIKNIKDEKYTIVPKMDGQLNLFYFELLADVKDSHGQVVGNCVVELLPGVYNEKMNISAVVARVKD
jgi:hypothetical protein